MSAKGSIRIGLLALLISLLPPFFDAVSHAVFAGALIVTALSGQAQEETNKRGRAFDVATNGSDAWSGTLRQPSQAGTDGPFATLARARDAMPKLKARGWLAGTVIVCAGHGHGKRTKQITSPAGRHGCSSAACPDGRSYSENPAKSNDQRGCEWAFCQRRCGEIDE